ncbi:craniofacial development protein 2-like [Cydia strobilella]|uniref:craniofacial development protein 2-like n=1 Tax=Cydia strobilella TaxID=1100964 RepID=UPI003007AC19
MKVHQKLNAIKVRASPVSDGQRLSNANGNAKAYPVSDGRHCANKLRIATWNIGSLTGRSQELAETLQRRNINICCIQELKWKGCKSRDIGRGYQLIYNGTTTKRNGIVLDSTLKQRLINVNRISDRLMCIKLALYNGPAWNIISVYAPQMGCNTSEKEEFWDDLGDLLQSLPKGEGRLVAGDLNGHVGHKAPPNSNIHGNYGYGTVNSQGTTIMELATQFDLPIVNTYFKKREEHLVTYKSGGKHSQIDYFLCDRSFLKYVKDCKVIPGEPLTTQHRILVACLTLPKWFVKQKAQKSQPRIKWQELSKPVGDIVNSKIVEYLKNDISEAPNSATTIWQNFHNFCTGTAKTHLGMSKGILKTHKDPKWWDDNVRKTLVEKKHAFKVWQNTGLDCDRVTYKILKKKVKKVVATTKASAQNNFYKKLEDAATGTEIFKLAKYRNNVTKDIKHNKYIKDNSGKLLTSDGDINGRWFEYYHQLLNEEFPHNKLTPLLPILGPVQDISVTETKIALTKMKNNKATGPDEIPIEVWTKDGVSRSTVAYDAI